MLGIYLTDKGDSMTTVPNEVYREAAINDATVLLAANHYGCNVDITCYPAFCSDHMLYIEDNNA